MVLNKVYSDGKSVITNYKRKQKTKKTKKSTRPKSKQIAFKTNFFGNEALSRLTTKNEIIPGADLKVRKIRNCEPSIREEKNICDIARASFPLCNTFNPPSTL